jgi:hypothetical protein
MKLEKLILEYENDFFNKDFCDVKGNLDMRIHDEFFEIGKSGQIFYKDSIIGFLNNLDSDRDIEIIDFKVKDLRGGLLIANYISNEKELGINALRTSIWMKEEGEWKLLFHQGTITELESY